MAGPRAETIVVVDALSLRTVGLTNVLDRLTAGTRTRVRSLTPDETKRFIDSDSCCSMIIYNVGSASVADHRHARWIKSLHGRGGRTPLVILSDSDSRKEVVAAFTAGAQGYLHAGTDPQLALQALALISKGGSYFPQDNPARHRSSGKVGAPTTEGVHPINSIVSAVDQGEGLVVQEANTAANMDDNPTASGLTERQKAVLALLGRGESNKAIARRLNIREGTVKVHVRHIMRRMGAANRTQVAVAASRANGAGSKDGL